jgi:hypothetical protein
MDIRAGKHAPTLYDESNYSQSLIQISADTMRIVNTKP